MIKAIIFDFDATLYNYSGVYYSGPSGWQNFISRCLNYSLDAVVQDLEDALDALSEVTGAITPDDILGSIFANFCVGK